MVRSVLESRPTQNIELIGTVNYGNEDMGLGDNIKEEKKLQILDL
jgi:hypothetical protein